MVSFDAVMAKPALTSKKSPPKVAPLNTNALNRHRRWLRSMFFPEYLLVFLSDFAISHPGRCCFAVSAVFAISLPGRCPFSSILRAVFLFDQ